MPTTFEATSTKPAIAIQQPTSERIASLDVLRGFALLGILLLNVLGLGLISAAYSNLGIDLAGGSAADQITWASVELLAEGAMRALFSILFGAGVVLFTTGLRAKSGALHYKRTFWLLIFGLFDAYILLWTGDILVTYAVAGAMLYWLRNKSVKTLSIIAGVLLVLISAQHGVMRFGLGMTHYAHETLQTVDHSNFTPEQLSSLKEGASAWLDFAKDFEPSEAAIKSEIAVRTTSYASVFEWNIKKANEMIFFVLPVFMLWDALTMMLVGMILFKTQTLQAKHGQSLHLKMMGFGFTIGLLINAFEVSRSLGSNFELIQVFAQLQPTYHIGRLAMAVGYLGLILWLVKGQHLRFLTVRLASTGKMALSNYLMHSLFGMLIFTGAGLGLLGELSRSELYPIVFTIWVFQLFASHWWLGKFNFGPVEWLWRSLTYGKMPAFVKIN